MEGKKNLAEDYFKRNIEENWDKLPPKVQEEIDNILASYKSGFLTKSLMCESPIEQLLFVRLMHWIESSLTQYQYYDPYLYMSYMPQKEVEVNNKKYRIDIYVEVHFKDTEYLFALECDGHDFHEKTKKQAIRDKQRERDLQSAGYNVIRFTGSEIWSDPSQRAAEAMGIIEVVSGLKEAIDKNIHRLMVDHCSTKDD